MARSKNNNQFKVDYAFPGLCSLCFTEIAEFEGSNSLGRPIITKLKGNFREITVLLDDNSKMKVSLCEDCFENIKPEDMGELMENEINGWQKEVDANPKFEAQKKLDYMDKYSERKITTRVDIPYGLGEVARVSNPRSEKLKVKKNS